MKTPIGIIGAGRVAREHERALRALGISIAAVCDPDPQSASELVREHPDARIYQRLDGILEDEEVPAAVIAVPNRLHAEIAIAALGAGKDILLEKPMAMNVAECDRIIDTARRAGRIVQLGFVCRTAPRVQLVRELIEHGEIGQIYHAKAVMHRQRGIPGLGRWFTSRREAGGGVLIDIGVHLIDLAMFLLGEQSAERVSAVCESRFGSPIDRYIHEEMWAGPPDPDGVFDVEDAATGLIRFPGSRVLELNVSWAVNMPAGLYRDGILLLGDRAGCFFDLWGDQFTMTREQGGRLVDERPEMDNTDAWDRAWRGQHEAFQHSIATRAEPAASAEQGRAVQAIVEAMYASHAAGQEVPVARAPAPTA